MENSEIKNIKILIEEFRQVWEHYRHLENARVKYLNFFFTVLFAVLGLISTDIVGSNTILTKEPFIAYISFYLLSLFVLFVFINVKRIGWVLSGYESVMKNIRELMYEAKTIPEGIDVRGFLPSPKTLKLFSLQLSAKIMLIISMALFNISILYSIRLWENLFAKIFLFLCLLALVFCESFFVVAKRKINKQ